jgi:DNA-binding transcriptional regulator YiaG
VFDLRDVTDKKARRMLRPLTGKDVERILKDHDLTQVAAGRLLGYTSQTISRMISSQRPVSSPAQRLLKLLAMGRLSIADLEMVVPQDD